MFIRDTYSLLAEAAAMDLDANTSSALTESQIDSIMESIEEVSEDIVYTAEMVSVIKVGDDYLTEMNALYPYMTSNGITSVAEALNNVARVNGLQEKAVGLLIESDKQVKDMINKEDTGIYLTDKFSVAFPYGIGSDKDGEGDWEIIQNIIYTIFDQPEDTDIICRIYKNIRGE